MLSSVPLFGSIHDLTKNGMELHPNPCVMIDPSSTFRSDMPEVTPICSKWNKTQDWVEERMEGGLQRFHTRNGTGKLATYCQWSLSGSCIEIIRYTICISDTSSIKFHPAPTRI